MTPQKEVTRKQEEISLSGELEKAKVRHGDTGPEAPFHILIPDASWLTRKHDESWQAYKLFRFATLAR